MVSRTKLAVLIGSVVLLTVLLALGLATVSAAPGVDLYITKLANIDFPGPVIAGEELFYRVYVYNTGSTTATNVAVTDTLPLEVTYLGSNPDVCTWTGSNPLTCDLGDIAPREGRLFEVKVLVNPDAVAWEDDGTITMVNMAEVGSEEADDDPSDNTVNHSIFVEDSADLSVIKMSKPDLHVLAGQPFTYTIIVENLGPSFARGVALIDNIVSSGAFTIMGDPWMNRPGDCWSGLYPGYDGEVLVCGLGVDDRPMPLEPKGYFVYDDGLLGGGQWIIQLTVVANETQDVNNVVNVFTMDDPEYGFIGTHDPDLSNNSAEDFIYVDDVADLSLDKRLVTASPPIEAGEQVTFRLTVDNAGPSTAEGVVVEDYLPAGVTLVGPAPTGCNGGTPGDPTDPLVCHLGDIAPRDSRVVDVVVKIDPDYPISWDGSNWVGYLRNDALVYSDIFDQDNSDNLVSRIADVRTRSDMLILKSCGPYYEVVAGAEHEYIVVVGNDGPSTVRNFRFWDKLPADVTYLDFAIEGGGGECFYTENLPGVLGGGQGVHCWLGDIAPGTERAVHLTVRVNADAPPDYDLYNSVPDWDADSDIGTVTGQQRCSNYVTGEPNLSIEKTSEPVKLYPGEQKIYHITVTNEGPSVAFDVMVTDTLPAGVEYETSTGDCRLEAGEVQCDLGDMGPGETGTFDIYARVLPDTPPIEIINTACVTSEWDNNENNNGPHEPVCDTATNYIMDPNQADLGLDKTVSPGPYYAGTNVTFTLTISNTGPLVAQNVVVEDLLPEGLTVEGVSVPEGSCTTGVPGDPNQPLICNLGNLEFGQEKWVEVYVHIDPSYSGVLENDAVVYSEVYDQDEGNNRAHVIVWIDAFSDLWMQKFGWSDVKAGEEIWYNIDLGNFGPSTAHDVYVDDRLPDGVGLINARVIVGEGSCVEGTALCSLGDMAPNEGRSIQVHGFVEPWVPGTVMTNTASLWAHSPFNGELWPDEFYGLRSEVTTTVHSEADLSIRKTSDPYKVYAGEQKRYDIEVTNHGPGVAYNVIVSDTLPSEVEYEISTVGCERVMEPGVLLGSSGYQYAPGELFSVDHGTAAATLIGQMLGGPLATEIEYDPSTGLLYAAENNVSNPFLHTIDPATGATLGTVVVGPYPGDPVVAGMEFVGPTLYATVHDWWWGTNSALYVLNPSTGFLSPVGPPTPYLMITGLAYDQATSTMYGVATASSGLGPAMLLTIDLSTGVATPVATIMVGATPLIKVGSIEFGPDGNLYGGLTSNDPNWPNRLVQIDTSTAVATVIGNTGYPITGLTWASLGTGELVCRLGEIPPGETSAFSIWVRVKPDTLGMINNQVDVSSDNDPNDGNDDWSEANLVLGKADLRVRKYGKPDGVVQAGDDLIYTVIVDNLGPGYAHQVVLRDMLSSSSRAYDIDWIDSDRPAHCSEDWWYEDEVRITCRLDDPLEVMSPSSSGRWVVKVYVEVDEEQSINNVAQVVGSDWDPDLSNNEAIVEHEIEPVADLELYKYAWGEIPDACDQPPYPEQPNRVAAGAMLRYELRVCNEGPSTAENVVLEDWGITPLLDITDVWWDYGVSCLKAELGEQGDTNRRLTCYLGYLDPPDYYEPDGGECKSVYIEGRLPSDVPEGTRLVNDAMVYGEVYDDENWNNFASNWTTVEVWADLAVEKSQEPETTLPGLEVIYTIVVTNTGPSDAHGVLISDTLPFTPTTMTVEGCASDGGQCDVPCEVPTCPAGECPWPDVDFVAQANIPAGGWVIYTLTAIPEWVPCDMITNTVQVVAEYDYEHDIDPCDENDFAYTESDPECNYVPLALKSYPGPDSPP